jgi:hypothetical protein
MEEWQIALLILSNIIFIVIIYFIFRRRKLYPIAEIRDENDQYYFSIFQRAGTFIVVNQIQPKYQAAKFRNWNDALSFVQNEINNWYKDNKHKTHFKVQYLRKKDQKQD